MKFPLKFFEVHEIPIEIVKESKGYPKDIQRNPRLEISRSIGTYKRAILGGDGSELRQSNFSLWIGNCSLERTK